MIPRFPFTNNLSSSLFHLLLLLLLCSSSHLVTSRQFYSNDDTGREFAKKLYEEELVNYNRGEDLRHTSTAPSLNGIPTDQYFSFMMSPGTISNPTHSDNDVTFFISVAAFRDPECVQSVHEIFGNAVNPRRVFLGVIEQNEHGDPTCVPDDFYLCMSPDFCPMDNIRRRRVVATKGKGPTYGRYISMLSYRGESYYMMIDSHTGFIERWDRRMLASIKKARSNRPVLSHYPNRWIKHGPRDREAQTHIAVMCNGHYLKFGFIRLDGRMFSRSNEPFMAPFAAAGFLFADAQLVHRVPFDPLLDYLFDGEEVLYSTRMWTHGFDMFAPEQSFVFHSYGRKNASKYWGTQHSLGNRSMFSRVVYWSRRRVQYFLRVTQENRTKLMVPRNISVGRIKWKESVYGLGKARSLSAYNKFAMIDPVHRKAPAWFCNKLAKQKGKV